ncbi:MAG: class I SAM-dependent DNA methyltransferase [Dehalococcoidia bacterium]|nr:class I SAM-dependent DNA methyltransferase [Dehalococcoidia bacterium]
MSPADFVAKWRPVSGKEMSAYMSHFDDLCRLIGHETPIQADPSASFFCFQKYACKDTGQPGFADVYYQRYFGWEYKGNHADLDRAYKQLLQYRENLQNPPLLIVSDFQQIIIHTNFTNTVKQTYRILLDDLLSTDPITGTTMSAIELLRTAFLDPQRLNPGLTPASLTEVAAQRFSALADILRGVTRPERRRDKPHTDTQIARFLTRLIFCMFASDAGLLPGGIITRIVQNNKSNTPALADQISSLFRVMKTGGPFGAERPIPYFNGGLFSDDEALPLWSDEVEVLLKADELDWSEIEPSIFGTLFERILDPSRRRQIGAHYTSRTDIETIVRPVLIEPLEREWQPIQAEVAALNLFKTGPGVAERRARAQSLLQGFLDRLASVKVLDPACGSGNFLYVSIALLKGLEQTVLAHGATWGIHGLIPRTHPRQLYGIEIDPYAHELASMVVWIGYLQWKHKNGIPLDDETPILEPLSNIAHKDAVLDLSDPTNPAEPEWPVTGVIVGNPPFLGGKLLRTNLGDAYVDALFRVWDGRVRREADLCCYWHEKARASIEAGRTQRAGLLATQGIRGGANRDTLRRIKASGDIFFAESDRPWILNGAAVHVSMIGFDDGSETRRLLDGQPVEGINPNLTGRHDLTSAKRLPENLGLSFMGDTKGGAFDIDPPTAHWLLLQPNPDGRSNSDIVRPWVNGDDLTGRPRGFYIIDFPPGTTAAEAALYEQPFEYVKKTVKPLRESQQRAVYRDYWWMHVRPRPGMRKALQGLPRYLVTPILTKYRLFVWLSSEILPDHASIAFARSDDYFFGVLHSTPHEAWALALGTRLEDRPRYTPTTCFETFPLPWPPGQEPIGDPRVQAIAAAAANLDKLRTSWLNPPLESLGGPDLKLRTLTNLYNQRPTWLDNAHRRLDQAVFAAYGWPADLTRDEILPRLLQLNLARAATQADAIATPTSNP